MLSEKEIRFLEHWERVRDEQSGFLSKLSRGLPMAMLFGIPILVSIALVYFLSPEWYTKISQSASSVSVTILIAVDISILFFSYARMHFKWEMNEQLYQELKNRQQKEDAANEVKNQST